MPARVLAAERIRLSRSMLSSIGAAPMRVPSAHPHQIGRLVHVLRAAGDRDRGVSAAISSEALAIAYGPDPHTRFTVSAGTCTGSPLPMAACRAGFILAPAWIT
ncbi:hypothetical protein [Cupriavidus lacunae]|uniref:hypothetical protein n=1 Tax=Cupriavidus lacunae TaxID=2666307 RepID=UPI003CC52F0A